MTPARLGRVLVLAGLAGVAGLGQAAAPRPVEFPVPELEVAVAPLPLNVTRPALEPPPPPPLAPPRGEIGAAPQPRFLSLVRKPLPGGDDPGGLACAFAALRGAGSLAECGIHRAFQGDLRGAREALSESVAREPRGAQASVTYAWLGEVALREGRHEEAERHFRAALELSLPSPLVPDAALGLAWVGLRRGDVAEAERVLGLVFAATPSPQVALLARFAQGVARLAGGRPDEALVLWDAVAAAGPPAPLAQELHFWRGVALARRGEGDKAQEALGRFLAAAPPAHPLRADAEAQAGWVALEHGAPAEAERRFLVAQRLQPRSELAAELREGLVRVYLALGDSVRAAAEARRLALDAPQSPRLGGLLLLIGDDALRGGDVTAASEEYRRLLQLPLPPAAAAYVSYRLAEALERLGQTLEAVRLYERLRDSGPVEGVAQRAGYRLGLAALRAGRLGEARTAGEAMLRAVPLPELREGALLLAAESAARGGDPNRAVPLFRLALQEYPDSPRASAVRLALGWAFHADGEPALAIRTWAEAALAAEVEIASQAFLTIADVSIRQGDNARAVDALREFVRLAPSHPVVEVARLDRGVLLVRTRAYGPAVQELEPLIPRVTEPVQQALLRRALGVARYHLAEYEVAERHFRQAAHWAPAEPSSWLGAGLAALAAGRLVEAEEALGRARLAPAASLAVPAAYALVLVAVNRKDAEAFEQRAAAFVERYPADARSEVLLYGLITAALERGDLDRTQAWVSRLIAEHPSSGHIGNALFWLAEGARERPALARDAYRAFLARVREGGPRAEARLGLAEAALALRDAAEAASALEAFLGEVPPDDPREPRARALLVRAHEARGDRAEAVRAAEAFLGRFPSHPLAPGIQLARGHLLLEAQQWDPARQALEAALEQGDPSVAAPAHVWLGELHRQRGDHEAALAAYLGATYLYPGTPWASRGLQGAAQSYVARQMGREAAILLRKLVAHPKTEPAVAQWARQALGQLGPVPAEDPAARLRRSPPRP